MKKVFLSLIVLSLMIASPVFGQNANSTSPQFPKMDNTDVQQKGADGLPVYNALAFLANLPYVTSSGVMTGGAADSDVDEYILYTPVSLKITDVKFIMQTPNVGAGNLPIAYLLAGADTVGVSDTIALSGSAGDIIAFTITAAERDVASGTNLIARINTPSGATVTTAVKGRLQVVWKPRK